MKAFPSHCVDTTLFMYDFSDAQTKHTIVKVFLTHAFFPG